MNAKRKIPKVSICIPAYNQVDSLKRAIESILMQDYEDYEVIITDDSVDDRLTVFIGTCTNRFNGNLKYFKNSENFGSPGNWNQCISKAEGEYIKILHHDDWFSYPDSLSILVELLDKNPEATIGFVSSKSIDIKRNAVLNINDPADSWIRIVETVPEMLIFRNFIGSPSATIFRINDVNLKFDVNLIWNVDLDFYVHLLKPGRSKLVYNSKDAINIGISDMQVTRECENNKNLILQEYFYFLNKWEIKDVKLNELIQLKTEDLIRRFNIKNINDIRKTGVTWRLPRNLRTIITFVNDNIVISKH